ncbi:MAG: exo-alpha-sialidase [Bacteroidaceae bacterium]|nr:exo-alpha-sialidase [Bacteroidaceae bacterium]
MKRNILFYALLFIAGISTANAQEFFSQVFKNGTPVHITNNRDKAFAIKAGEAGKDAKSGMAAYTADEIWYLVGNADGFRMYNHALGKKHALKLEGNESGAAAVMASEKEATVLTITAQEDGSYAISPKNATGQSFNMFGGAGKDIKLYSSSDKGGHWNFKTLDMSRTLEIEYNADCEGALETNYKIGEIAISIDGQKGAIVVDRNNIPKSTVCYLPKDAKVGIACKKAYHGWKMDVNGVEEIAEQPLPEKGLQVAINITADKENRYQYLYYSPDEKGVPYRIPAIATTANGYVFAINDYRPCGNDIGFGEVDLVMRHSTKAGDEWDETSWTEPVKIADGLGKEAAETWLTGFGDPAIVADRERNEILVMSVCGNRVCWHGNYGAGTEANPENPNRMARLRIIYNEESGEWEATEPEEVTYDIYPLFKDKSGKAHVGSMFIGAGRIAQSSMIKVGDYYRIYCAVWAVETGSYRHHNYALYSDDFGKSWHLLGELGNDFNDSPAPYGNEPKCEELPDGSVLLSSRKGYGRYFNVFHYSNFEKAEGYWDGAVATDLVGNLKFGSNDTNGEPLRVGNVLFQSVPTGNNRSGVSIFYKVLEDNPATYTPTELSNGWKKIQITDRESAYSSMCILPDGNIGLYYEEEPGGYSMVYVPVEFDKTLDTLTYCCGLPFRCSICKKGLEMIFITIEDPIEE